MMKTIWVVAVWLGMAGFASAQVSEGFETGLPSAAPTVATDYTLGSGVWTLVGGNRTTTSAQIHGGAAALKLASGISSADSPTFASVTNVSFWARGSGGSTLTLQRSVGGGAFSAVATQGITGSYAQYTVSVNASGNVRVRFLNNGTSQTHYIDDVVFTTGGATSTPTSTPTTRPTPTATTPPTPTPTNGATATPTATAPPTATPTTRPTATPTATPTASSSTTYQAETAVMAGGSAAESTNAGFTGTGYCNFPANGGSLEFQGVNGGAGGAQTLRFRYALASGSRTGRLLVNGAAQNITFDASGAFTTWVNKDVAAALNAGTGNTVRLETTGADLANVDSLQIVAGTPPPTSTPTATPTATATPRATPTPSSQLIFPGAVGFGVDSPAGRGGQVLKVTNLNASGSGSFAAALATSGPRIIVFEVGGIIDLNRAKITVTQPFVTIAGQTAPSPGITLIRGALQINTHDVLMKHIRFRIGDAGAAAGSGFEPDVTTYGPDAYNIVIDHCSVAWGVDENLSISGPRFDGVNGTSRRVTLSNNIIAEGLYDSVHSKGIHSMGSLIHDYCTDIAVIGNLYAHNNERNPWFKGFATGVIVNNLVYNPGLWPIRLGAVVGEWDGSGITPQGPRVSVVGNYMRHGVNTPSGKGLVGTNSSGSAYMSDNIAVDRSGAAMPLSYGGVAILGTRPSWPGNLTAYAASNVVANVTARAGARPRNRDSVDQRIVSEFQAGSGGFVDSQNDVGGYPTASMTTRALTVPASDIDGWLHSFSVALE